MLAISRSLPLFTAILLSGTLLGQQGSLLDQLRQRIGASQKEQTPEEQAAKQERMRQLLSIIRDGAKEVYRSLPEDSQQAITERRKAWMEAMASGVDDLTGDDIERWLENSDNVILQSLSRDSDAPSVNAEAGVDRLPQQWWFGKQDAQLAALLTQPPQTIIRGEQREGRPVWFVNGITTKKAEAIAMADLIVEQLDRPVHLLHNPTFMEDPGTSGLEADGYGTDDLSECFHDRIWPATIVNRLNKLDAAGLTQLVGESKTLQGNPTTRQLAYVLLHAKEPIDLITHSQGCIIARNAMFTMAMLGRAKQVEDNIAWIAAGIPLNDKELSPRPRQTTVLDVGNDPIAKIVGMRGGTREYQGTDHSFTDHYCTQLNCDHLWCEDPDHKHHATGKHDATEKPVPSPSSINKPPTRVKL